MFVTFTKRAAEVDALTTHALESNAERRENTVQPRPTLYFYVNVAHLKSHVNSSHRYLRGLCLIIPSPLL